MNLQQAVNQMLRDIENPGGNSFPVVFYERARYNEEKSLELKRPIYDLCLYIRKHTSNLSVYDQPARDNDIKEFPKQYELFLRTKEAKEAGIPIGTLPGITPREVAVCEACKVFTIEALSKADAVLVSDIGDESLKERAIAYLSGESEKDKEIARLKAQLEGLKNDSTNDSPKRSRRNATVRESADSSEQQQ